MLSLATELILALFQRRLSHLHKGPNSNVYKIANNLFRYYLHFIYTKVKNIYRLKCMKKEKKGCNEISRSSIIRASRLIMSKAGCRNEGRNRSRGDLYVN